MSKGIVPTLNAETIQQVVLGGDLSRLSAHEKLSYYSKVCDSLGLNSLTQPFAYIRLNGKEVLYAKRDCTDQLRNIHKISIKITAREKINDVYVVTAQASGIDGRFDESTGAVAIAGLKGDNLANAYLKAETKAKRRVTLSICGLGLLDETEVESIPEARPVSTPAVQSQASNLLDHGGPEEDLRHPGEYIVRAGKKYNGTKLKDIPTSEIANFMDWIKTGASESFKNADTTKEFLEMTDLYLRTAGEPDYSTSEFED